MTNHPATNANQLAEAASKISLLSPDQFQLPLQVRPDLVKEESIITHSPSPPPSQTDSAASPAPHKLELVLVSGNSSPSREVANILEEVGQYQYQEQVVEEEEEDEDSPTTDRTFQGIESTPSSTSVKLSHSAVFPTPPAVPQQAMALPTEMDSVGLAIMRQIKQERDVQAFDMAGKRNDGHDGAEAGRGGKEGRSRQTWWCLLSHAVSPRRWSKLLVRR